MIIFRPFKVGDLIEGAGVLGTVEEIQIFTTMLKTPDNKKVIVPNAKLTADNITNFTAKSMTQSVLPLDRRSSRETGRILLILTAKGPATKATLKPITVWK